MSNVASSSCVDQMLLSTWMRRGQSPSTTASHDDAIERGNFHDLLFR